MKDHKRFAVKAFNELKYLSIAVGDSYNDINMLKEADHGILFRTTEKIAAEYPDFPLVYEYEELRNALEHITGSDKN